MVRIICMTLGEGTYKVRVNNAREEMEEFAACLNSVLDRGYSISTAVDRFCPECRKDIHRLLSVWDPVARVRRGMLHVYGVE